MKKRACLIAVLPGIFLVLSGSACSSAAAGGSSSPTEVKTPEQKRPVPAKKEAAAQKKKISLSAGEIKYYTALRERDKIKREQIFKEARTLLEQETKDPKACLRAHFLLGMMAEHGRGMKTDDLLAARHYRIAADRGFRDAKLALAEFWVSRRMLLADAFKMVRSIPDHGKDHYALYLQGFIRYSQMRQDEGFEFFRKLLSLPNIHQRYHFLIRKIVHNAYETFFHARNYRGAKKELLKLQSVDGKNYMIPFYLGLVENRMGNAAGAEEYFKKSLAMNPSSPFAYRELAYLQAKSNRKEEALDNIKIAYAISGKLDLFLSSLAEICIMNRDHQTLLRFLASHKTEQKAFALRLKKFRIAILLMERKYSAAYPELEKLMKEPSEASSGENQENMALAASGAGKLSVAVRMYEKILQRAFQVVPGMNLAELYVVKDQYEKALALLENKAFIDRGDVTTRCIIPYLKASALLACGKEKEASEQIALFEKALISYRKAGKKDWDVHLFRIWLKENKTFSEKVRKEIIRMTDLIAGDGQIPSVPAEKTEKKSPVKK